MSGVQSVERAFAVLQCLSAGPAGVSDLAARTDLPKSTVARLLATLVEVGAVEQPEPGGDYRLGQLVLDLAAGAVPSDNLLGIARQHLVELAEALDEAAGLSVLTDDGGVLYLDQADGPNPVQVRDWTGERLPFHCVSSGLVMVAHRPRSEWPSYLARPHQAFTSATTTDPDKLEHRLRQIRERGIAWTIGELADDIASVAAPVLDRRGEMVGSVHVHGPTYRFPGERDTTDIEDLVAEAAHRIGRRLRY
ncbi:MAG: IclR family transcriptional regulator [Actinomyces sp.]|nr:MAG: IclR family transcriptional regulator [Actinomyces sp.]